MTIQLLEHAEITRREISQSINLNRKSQLGQFMTPAIIARFMVSLFPESNLSLCRLLDAGAGVGSLTSAFLDRWGSGDGLMFKQIEVEAYEIDAGLCDHLRATLQQYSNCQQVRSTVWDYDFIEDGAVRGLQCNGGFTHAILNPPYKKIKSNSEHRRILRRAGIETVNLYTAFVAISIKLMAPQGQIVAIIPRSFCNGPYYRPFRKFMLQHCALRHIHLFDSRAKAFKDDSVLQENVIIRLERGGKQGEVEISHSTDDSFSDLVSHTHDFSRIVFADDPEKFIHIPMSHELSPLERPALRCTLPDIAVVLSTGPVVDFRLRDEIISMPEQGTVPLLYAGHFAGQETQWPKEGIKRGNALRRNDRTEKWLYPTGCYTVVRRFSSKEERRRIVASVVQPEAFANAEMLAFENHLNIFHNKKHGLNPDLAHGLAAYLNTTAVDEHFRRFNGHTQVNATDLRTMRYPDRPTLIALGEWAKSHKELTQDMLDERLEVITR